MNPFERLVVFCNRTKEHWKHKISVYMQNAEEFDPEEFRNLERIQHMDEDLPEDIEDILEISAILEIREIDIFGLAYRWWYGKSPNPRVIENHFVRYMFNSIVPHWVRQYNRMILDLCAEGKLDRDELGISRLPSATPQSVKAGMRYTAIVFLALGFIILIAELAMHYSVFSCMFPPCY